MQLRRATMADMYEMQHCNLRCLPENYNMRFYYYHLLSWPQLLYVQEDYNHNTVGYVLSKMEEEESEAQRYGHITSLAVLRTHRKLGIASRVMRASMQEMDDEYKANFCSLHVRRTNDAALHLYQDTLGFRCAGVEERYYVDDEDAYHMKRFFHAPNPGTYVNPSRRLVHKPVPGEPTDTAASGAATTAAAKPAHGDATKRGKTGKQTKQTPKEVQNAMAELLEEFDAGKKGGKGQANKAGGKGSQPAARKGTKKK